VTDDPFVTHRSLLFTVAYEMLGSAADAEDVVQESWLRWADVDRATVRDPRSYLVRIVTRQALNRLRTLARRREEYVAEWLPEPLLRTTPLATPASPWRAGGTRPGGRCSSSAPESG
jgi:DNA-directed RNA polymerase specialized sigma24 family protein